MIKIARILAASVLSAIPLFAASAYMTDSADEFGTIDLTTGVFTPITQTATRIFGMGFNANGTLYATDPNTPTNVYTINPHTGATSAIGAANAYSAYGSTVGPNGSIYAVSSGASAVFYSISTTTLTTNTINPSLGFVTDGLAVFSAGEFYTDAYVPSGSDILVQIDPVTGVATQDGTGIGAQADAGTLVGTTIYAIGSAGGTPILGTIDLATGSGTLVAFITGMAAGASPDLIAYDNIPEPATALLMALCLPILAVMFRGRLPRFKSAITTADLMLKWMQFAPSLAGVQMRRVDSDPAPFSC